LREKSFGQRRKFGQAGGNFRLWEPERFFSVVTNIECTCALFGRAIKKNEKMRSFDNFTGKMLRKGWICLDFPYCAGGRGKCRAASRHVSPDGPVLVLPGSQRHFCLFGLLVFPGFIERLRLGHFAIAQRLYPSTWGRALYFSAYIRR